MTNTIVIGLGNPILTDDGVGVLAARELERRFQNKDLDGLHFPEAAVGGIRLAELLDGYDRAIIIDALVGTDRLPGEWAEFTIEDLRRLNGFEHTSSAHDTTLPIAIDAAIHLGMKPPGEIILFGMSVSDIINFSEKPTETVMKAMPEFVQAIESRLRSLPDLTGLDPESDNKMVEEYGLS